MIRAILTAAVILMALGIPCLAQIHSAVFTVPFAFQFDSKQLPAGQYLLEVDNFVATLRNLDNLGLSTKWAAPMLRSSREDPWMAHLHFLLSGGQYYLHLMEADSHQSHITVPKPLDTALAKRSPAVKTLTLVAD